jgi:hypothetical protein
LVRESVPILPSRKPSKPTNVPYHTRKPPTWFPIPQAKKYGNQFYVEPDRVFDYTCEIFYEEKGRFEK